MLAGVIWVLITQEARKGVKLDTHALSVGYKIDPAEEIASEIGVIAWRKGECAMS